MNYSCGKRVGIKIYENEKNKHKLYYYCVNRKCTGFLGQCWPTATFPTSPTVVNTSPQYRQKSSISNTTLAMLNDLRDDLMILQNEK